MGHAPWVFVCAAMYLHVCAYVHVYVYLQQRVSGGPLFSRTGGSRAHVHRIRRESFLPRSSLVLGLNQHICFLLDSESDSIYMIIPDSEPDPHAQQLLVSRHVMTFLGFVKHCGVTHTHTHTCNMHPPKLRLRLRLMALEWLLRYAESRLVPVTCMSISDVLMIIWCCCSNTVGRSRSPSQAQEAPCLRLVQGSYRVHFSSNMRFEILMKSSWRSFDP
jgi:hypothetical protein